ncbi:type II 3-dehydroquinate dehydratase [Aquipuribacter nitratireducens]|uniref:3-dehydroquinate dehydratase n=1 Tax=Aquipuribacter nitratireducens TaxID=650104 RepID=A0ABW0GRP2_9MICO
MSTTGVLVLNGPNLGRLGTREPDVYGHATHDDLVALVAAAAERLGLDPEVRQSDDEADIVRWLHEAVDTRRHVVINPAAFTHYSYALRDAAALVSGAGLVLVEVHISNPHGREAFRRHSVVSPVATGVIAGFGLDGYRLALDAVARHAA